MKKVLSMVTLTIVLLFVTLLLFNFSMSAMAAEHASQKPIVIYPVKQGISKPLRAIKAPKQLTKVEGEDAALPVGYPQRRGSQQAQQPLGPVLDPALQQSSPTGTMPATIANFEGLDNIAGYYPPDTCGDVGPNHYVQVTNVYFQVYDKTTGAALLPADMPNNSLWAGFGGVCETTNDGDPIVLYDQFADRWLFSQFSVRGPSYDQCIAISQTGDPTGAWYLYDYQMSTTIMNDYPKFGVWPDAYYMAINQFDTNGWAGQGVVAFDRASMLTGAAAPMVYIDMVANTDLGSMLPADADGLNAPPPGTPNYFVQFDDDAWGFPADQLEIYEFTVDWATPANSTFTVSGVSPLAVNPFTTLGENTIPQPDTPVRLDNLGDRLMYRLQYRNFGTHQSMVVNHTVDADGAGVAGIRWYELQDTGSDWSIKQQGTYAGDAANTDHRWMGSIAMDFQGNMALGYSVSSTATYPSIRYAGRLVGDPANTLSQGESTIIDGTGSQTGTASRWGDYSMMSVDPTDDCTFWYTTEYYETTSDAGWQTRIASFKFPTCTAADSGILDGTVTGSGAAPIAGVTVSVDDGAAINISTTTAADGTYSFASLPVGTYTVTVEKWGYVTGNVAGVGIVDGVTTIQDFVLSDSPIYTLSGTVTDANNGQPLYTELDYSHGTVWTNPVTGMYSVDLPEAAYSVTAKAAKYDVMVTPVTLNSDTVQDFALLPDATCTAPGYSFPTALSEDFDICGTPAGWTINNLGGDCDWTVSDPDTGRIGNNTGGAGCFADADSDACGNGTTMNTELITPSVDCSTMATTVFLEFNYDINDSGGADTFEVDVSVDGGTIWTTVWDSNATDDRGPKTAQVDISTIAAGQAAVLVRFHYIAPDWDWWWQVDDVYIYEPTCITPADGGYVVGHIYDANTLLPLNGALVDDGSGNTTTTIATPNDDSLPDGFYSLYVPASGPVSLTASLGGGYETNTQSVSVPSLDTIAQDFHLQAGIISTDPTAVNMLIASNTTKDTTLLVNNDGTFGATFDIVEINAPLPAIPAGPFAVPVRHVSPKHLYDMDASGARYEFLLPDVPVIAGAGDIIQSWATGLPYAWGIGHQGDSQTLWLGDLAGAGGGYIDYEFSPAGAATGNTIDVAGIGAIFMADFAYDWINGTLWQVALDGENCIHELDPATLTVTGNSICPAFGTSQLGLAYNPVADTFYAGSWLDSTIHEFDRTGAILRSTNIGLGISGLAFNSSTNQLFVMVNDLAANSEVYVVDVPESGDFSVIGQFDIAGFTDFGGSGLAINCEGHLWAVDQYSQIVYEVDSGDGAACSLDIPWLTETPTSATVGSGGSQSVTLRFNSAGFNGGDVAEAFLHIGEDTPYKSVKVPVTMTVGYSVIPYAGTGGAISPATPQLVVPGDTVTFTVTADPGYLIDSVTGCGGTLSGATYTTAPTIGNCSVSASFIGAYAIDASAGPNGTISPAGTLNVKSGSNEPFMIMPNPGFHIEDVLVDSVSVGPVPFYMFLDVSANHAISATFASNSYVIASSASPGGTVDPLGSVFVAHGGSKTFTITPDSEYDLADVVVNGVSVGAVSSHTFTDVQSNQSISAVFTIKTYTITAITDGNGTITPPGITTVSSGDSQFYVIDPNTGYHISDILVDGISVGSVSNYSFRNVQETHTIAASFAIDTHTLQVAIHPTRMKKDSVTSDVTGIICPDDCEEVYDYGTVVILTVSPEVANYFVAWSGDCTGNGLTCSVTMDGDRSVTAEFKPFPWSMFVPAILNISQP